MPCGSSVEFFGVRSKSEYQADINRLSMMQIIVAVLLEQSCCDVAVASGLFVTR